MKISRLQKVMCIVGLSSCLQARAMQPVPVTEPVATYDVGLNEKLEITSVPVQDDQHKIFAIVAAHQGVSCAKTIERSRSSLDLSRAATPITPNVITIDRTDKSVGTEENNDKDETLSASSEHFSAELEVGKKGSWFHCKTHCKSKTVAKYMATAAGGLLAGLLL